jgi:hypothetical protein
VICTFFKKYGYVLCFGAGLLNLGFCLINWFDANQPSYLFWIYRVSIAGQPRSQADNPIKWMLAVFLIDKTHQMLIGIVNSL